MKKWNVYQKVIFILTVIAMFELLTICDLKHDIKNHECEVPVAAEAALESVEPVEPEKALQSLGEFKITAYCPCLECSEGYGNNTSTGAVATEGRTIAVDPKIIPYGTEVIIDGHRYVAEDCGGAIKQNRIDMYFEDHQEATNFGVQNKEVFIDG